MAKTKLSLMRCEVCGGQGAEIMTDFDGAGQVDGRHVECKHCGAEPTEDWVVYQQDSYKIEG